MTEAVLELTEREPKSVPPPRVETPPTSAMPSGQRAKGRHVPLLAALLCAALSIPVSLWMMFGRSSDRAEALPGSPPLPQVAHSVRPGEPFQPIIPISGLDPHVVELGRRLFFDPRISGDGTISCSSCHLLENGGADGRRVSIGIGGAPGGINSLSVFNAAYNFRQFWDGRAATLEEQVDGSIENPIEMGSGWPHVLQTLAADSTYVKQFRQAFGEAASADLVRRAIADFERTLTTPNSRFDQWLKGDDQAMTELELAGYRLFKEYQCISCHQSTNLGGSMYQRLGVMSEYFARDREETTNDLGRFNVTGNEQDRYLFRVPPLRNVELTAPYFHDGSADTLEDAVTVMIENQLGRDVEPNDLALIVDFLKTLTGDQPESTH